MGFSWQMLGAIFQQIVVLQCRGKYSKSCFSFMKPGSQSATHTYYSGPTLPKLNTTVSKTIKVDPDNHLFSLRHL